MNDILAAISGTGGVEISKKYFIFDFIHPPSQRGDASKTFSRILGIFFCGISPRTYPYAYLQN